jgi:hypothetical protein
VTRKSKFLRSFLRLSGCFSLAVCMAAVVAEASASEPTAAQQKRLRFKIYDRDIAQGADVLQPIVTRDYSGADVLCAEVVMPGGRREPAFMTLKDFWWWQDSDRAVLPTLEHAESADMKRLYMVAFIMSGCASALKATAALQEFVPQDPKIKQWVETQDKAFASLD